MLENQVCYCENKKTHTTNFKWLKDLPLSENDKTTLGQFLENQEDRIEALENKIKNLETIIKAQTAILSKLNLK